tara:strand:+ start:1533 stop:2945 length:1413 start_codon:yes stop_codon:yes gene_type:complete
MSLRAFGKGFFNAAGPSFVHGMQQQQGRIETRRQEGRQDAETKRKEGREDEIRKTGFERLDAKTAYDNAKTDGLGASNESVEAVDSWYDALPPKLQDQFKGTRNQYKTKASRMKRNRELDIEGKRAAIDASGAQGAAANLRTERDRFGLVQEQGVQSGREQVNLGSLKDENGAAAASSFFYETIKDGATPNNTTLLRSYAKMLDAYHGGTEFGNQVQQGLIRGGDRLVEEDAVNNLDKYSPEVLYQMALGVSSTSPEIATRIRRLAGGRTEGLIESAADNIYDTTYTSSLNMTKTPAEAGLLAEEAANRFRGDSIRRSHNKRLVDVGKRVSSAMESRDIKTIMKRVRQEITVMPNLNPTQRQLKELEMLISQRLNLDPMADAAGSGSAGPLGGMQGPAEQALPDSGKLTEPPKVSTFADEGSLWEKHDIGGKLMEAGKFAALGPGIGPAAYGMSKVADATGLSVDVGFND